MGEDKDMRKAIGSNELLRVNEVDMGCVEENEPSFSCKEVFLEIG